LDFWCSSGLVVTWAGEESTFAWSGAGHWLATWRILVAPAREPDSAGTRGHFRISLLSQTFLFSHFFFLKMGHAFWVVITPPCLNYYHR
jgi:hypothetical protein